MTKVLTGTIDPFDDEYQPPLSVTLQSVEDSSSFLELDIYSGKHPDTGLLSAALWHDIGMAEGWTTPHIVRRGSDTFVSGSFSLRFVCETVVRFYAQWHRDAVDGEVCVAAEAMIVSPNTYTKAHERFRFIASP